MGQRAPRHLGFILDHHTEHWQNMYNETLLDHFSHPRNVGVIENADGHSQVKSPVHNDLVDLYILVQDGRIADVKYRVHGCAAAIAATSMTSEMAKGLSLDTAIDLNPVQIAAALGGLPESKIQCSVLAPRALHEAIEDYWRKGKSALQPG